MVYGQLMAGGLPSLNGIFFLGAEELHFADQEKVRLDGSDVWWHVIGRFWVPARFLVAPPPPISACHPSGFCIQPSTVQRRM